MMRLISFALLVTCVVADVTLTCTELGSSIQCVTSGSLNCATLTNPSTGSNGGVASLGTFLSAIGVQPTAVRQRLQCNAGTWSPDLHFTTGAFQTIQSTSGTDPAFELQINSGSIAVSVPNTYTNGAPLTGSATWNGANTFADLNLVPGTYVYTSSVASQTVTIQIGPSGPPPIAATE